MTVGIGLRELAKFATSSSPVIPGILKSRTRQPVLSRWPDSRKGSADSKDSTWNPKDSKRFLTDRRIESSSSTTETTLVSRTFTKQRLVDSRRSGQLARKLGRAQGGVHPTLDGSGIRAAQCAMIYRHWVPALKERSPC